jgi:transcriptional regulator with XRE-family HTH domain
MDRDGLAGFLRKRREVLQPEDVGLPRGLRRRTAGLRREEVAALAEMSADYYSRIERGSGPQPSEQILAAIARGLRLTLDERDHLFLLAGYGKPRRTAQPDHVSPGMMRVLDRLADTPAQVMSGLGETLVQTPAAVALFGDETHFAGHARSLVYRWYTDPASRCIYPEQDHDHHGRAFTAGLWEQVARDGPGSPAARLADALRGRSAEFAAHWDDHRVDLRLTGQRKRISHPELGPMELDCQVLLDPDQAQALLVFTAVPGSESADKLRLLNVIGAQRFDP